MIRRFFTIVILALFLAVAGYIIYTLESTRTDKCGGVTCVNPNKLPFSHRPSSGVHS